MPRLRSAPLADQLSFVLELEPEIGSIVTDATDAAGEAIEAIEAIEAPSGSRDPGELDDRQPEPPVQGDWRAILDFERGWSGTPAAKQRAIWASFAISSARYHQLLDRALELPDALAYDAPLVRRLRRIREARRSKRFAQRVDAAPRTGAGEEGSRGG